MQVRVVDNSLTKGLVILVGLVDVRFSRSIMRLGATEVESYPAKAMQAAEEKELP
jgi:hypothetical protein